MGRLREMAICPGRAGDQTRDSYESELPAEFRETGAGGRQTRAQAICRMAAARCPITSLSRQY